ncbi:BfmA/BtgA family mobilization protein [Sphingobacterium endophyticum]|uniref:BfmA/BtgA family mobilization protein n=1 Tax=Sphingobacterium endophyticum TaxID=2546448 RepID=UPI0012E239E0|nr:BfmA/BtgA family mobilization protein [Sphingobacterium endophyticum]
MEGKIEKNRSVKFSLQVDTKLDNLARKLGRTKRALVIQMIDYFFSTKKDPADINDHALRNQLSQGINRILSFIKQQEKDLLVPNFNLSSEVMKLLHNQVCESAQHSQALHDLSILLKGMNRTLDSLNRQLDSEKIKKSVLITNAVNLVSSFLKERDAIGWSLNSAKKDELYKKLISDIYKL